MNTENNETPEPHVLILKLTDKLNLRRGEKIIALSNLSIYYPWKNIKSWYNKKLLQKEQSKKQQKQLVTGDLVRNKIADKITSVSKRSSAKHWKKWWC